VRIISVSAEKMQLAELCRSTNHAGTMRRGMISNGNTDGSILPSEGKGCWFDHSRRATADMDSGGFSAFYVLTRAAKVHLSSRLSRLLVAGAPDASAIYFKPQRACVDT
jgi:hypothetical protein